MDGGRGIGSGRGVMADTLPGMGISGINVFDIVDCEHRAVETLLQEKTDTNG